METTEPAVTPEVCQAVLQEARELYSHSPDWVTFFQHVFGPKGIVRSRFYSVEALAAFEKTSTYSQLRQMLATLHKQRVPGPGLSEPTKVITVRLPASLHRSLYSEACLHETSVNKLCIAKLMQLIDDSLVPKRSPERDAARFGSASGTAASTNQAGQLGGPEAAVPAAHATPGEPGTAAE